MTCAIQGVPIAQAMGDEQSGIELSADDGYTAIHAAATRASADMVEILLRGGANVDEQTIQGICPLYIASCRGNQEIVNVLLDANADVAVIIIINSISLACRLCLRRGAM